MTRKVFWDDPYCTELETAVASVEGPVVTLEDTIFYAFAGGQESDAGWIAGFEVLEARKQGRDIFYTLEEGHKLVPGAQVRVEIDWPRRYALMRLHFAAELVLELVYKKFGDPPKIGAHISADKARIDFALDSSVKPSLPDLTNEAMEIVGADVPITSAFSDEPNERRFWQVPGFAKVPCGGTHLKRTGEVGDIALKRNNIGRGKERIEISVSSG